MLTTTKFFISANDVLAGKVDLDRIDAMYVAVYGSGIVGPGMFERLMEAVNYMAKFGWRLRGCLERNCIMEKAASA